MANVQQKYKIEIYQVNELTQTIESNCNEIMFVNKGLTRCTIDLFPLDAGEFLTFGGNKDEICVKSFTVNSLVVGGLFIVRKNYI